MSSLESLRPGSILIISNSYVIAVFRHASPLTSLRLRPAHRKYVVAFFRHALPHYLKSSFHIPEIERFIRSPAYAVILLLTFGKLETNADEGLDWIHQIPRTPKNRLWNPWIMLSMPGAGVIYFAVFIIAFLWHSGATNEKDEDSKPSPKQQYVPRITATFIFVLGIIYLSFMIRDAKSTGSDSSKMKYT
ncbi:hypothetical protein B0H13DRAFT_2305348 [Mycena leptocephala]|nr:hypothetical protein B0H13DRAFT_2305348 [Mycena leptocephala]